MEIQEKLEQHWSMDSLAAQVLAEHIIADNEQDKLAMALEQITPEMALVRDANRLGLAQAFCGLGKAAIFGLCSQDSSVNYRPVFDFLQEIQAEHTDSTIAYRGNVSKPRSKTGWRGQGMSVLSSERASMFEIYKLALSVGVPIVTEITDAPQLGELAPYLSAAWLGARDMDSTALRYALMGMHLPFGIKNGMTGATINVKNALQTIRSNSKVNEGSGMNLGSIASTLTSRGIATGLLPIKSGNNQGAIFARGYELPKHLNESERRTLALQHLSNMCVLAEELDCGVLIDGTHGVAPMFSIESKDQDRLLGVIQEINSGIQAGAIDCAWRIRGVIGEVGPIKGRTDPNFIIDKRGKALLRAILAETFNIIDQQQKT